MKYKKGKVADKKLAFRHLQVLIRKCLSTRFPALVVDDALDQILKSDWNKSDEDRVDAFLCALIGYNHYLTRGAGSDPFGDINNGFILILKRI